MKTEFSYDQKNVKIYGNYSPWPVIASVEVVELLGGDEAAYHEISRLKYDDLLPHLWSESHPITLRDIELARRNEELGYRRWRWYKKQGQDVHRSTGYDMVWGYGYQDGSKLVIVDDNDNPFYIIELESVSVEEVSL